MKNAHTHSNNFVSAIVLNVCQHNFSACCFYFIANISTCTSKQTQSISIRFSVLKFCSFDLLVSAFRCQFENFSLVWRTIERLVENEMVTSSQTGSFPFTKKVRTVVFFNSKQQQQSVFLLFVMWMHRSVHFARTVQLLNCYWNWKR